MLALSLLTALRVVPKAAGAGRAGRARALTPLSLSADCSWRSDGSASATWTRSSRLPVPWDSSSSSALPSSAWAARSPVCGDAEAVGDTAAASTRALANLTTLAGSQGSYPSSIGPGLVTRSSLLLKEPTLAFALYREVTSQWF